MGRFNCSISWLRTTKSNVSLKSDVMLVFQGQLETNRNNLSRNIPNHGWAPLIILQITLKWFWRGKKITSYFSLIKCTKDWFCKRKQLIWAGWSEPTPQEPSVVSSYNPEVVRNLESWAPISSFLFFFLSSSSHFLLPQSSSIASGDPKNVLELPGKLSDSEHPNQK